MGYQVSILVPVYDVEQYIERCARSLFEQDYENIEYVFVDDCSPDHSIEQLEKVLCDYPKRKEQVRIIRHERNRGLGAARNTAVANASGLFLMHCDSDDWMDARAVSLLVDRQLLTNADIVSGGVCAVYKDGKRELEQPESQHREELLLQMLTSQKPSYHTVWRRLIRASLYHDHDIKVREGMNVGEDWQVVPRLVYYAQRVAAVDQVVYYYDCTNQTSYSQRLETNRSLWEQGLTSYEILRGFFEGKEKEYEVAASEMAIYNYWVYGHYAAKQHDRDFFEKFKAAINGEYSDYQYVLGYKNPLKKWFQQQYHLYGLFLRTRSFVYRNLKKTLGVG